MNEATFRDVGSEPQAATLIIDDEKIYAPTAAEFLRVLDDESKPVTNRVFPPLIYTDFNETPDSTKHIIKRIGVYANYSPKTFLAILAGWTPPEDVLAKLRELQARYEALEAEYAKYSSRQAEADYRSQRGNEVKRRSANEPEGKTIQSMEEFKTAYIIRRRAIDDSILPLTQQAAALARPVIAAALDRVRQSMAIVEENERAQSAEWDLPWLPSLFWKCHASILVRLTGATTIEKLCQGVHPRNMLRGVIEL
jgi:hypothetical protein